MEQTTQQESNRFFFKELGFASNGLSIFFASAAITKLTFWLLTSEPNRIVAAIIASYENITESAFGWLEEPIQSFLFNTFPNLNLHLYDYWKEVLILLSLYFSMRAGSYWSAGFFGRAVGRIFLGVGVAFVSAVVAGLIAVQDAGGNFLLCATPMLGIMAYDSIDAAISSTFRRHQTLSWSEDFWRYWKFAAPAPIVGMFAACMICFFFRGTSMASTEAFGFTILLCFTIMLAFYWGARGILFALAPVNRMPEETIIDRFIRSSNFFIFVKMIATLIMSALMVFFGS